MGKVNDIRQYWSELAAKGNVDPEKAKAVAEALADQTVAKVFTDGFKPLPDYSSDLDSVRDRTKQEIEGAYQKWYTDEQAKYQAYLAGLERLKAYETKYGPLDGSGDGGSGNGSGGDGNGNGSSGLTREEIERLLDGRLSARDATYLDYMEVRESHMSRFKEPLDKAKFETFWREHPELGNMRTAYKEFIAPEIEKLNQADIDAKLNARYQEGLRDGASRKAIPNDGLPKTFSPLMDKNLDLAKLSDSEQDRHSRESFFQAFRNPTGDGVKPT